MGAYRPLIEINGTSWNLDYYLGNWVNPTHGEFA
jgi:hypothetical protein